MSQTKRCCRCHETLPVNHFSKDQTRKDGLSTKCMKCVAELRRELRARKKEVVVPSREVPGAEEVVPYEVEAEALVPYEVVVPSREVPGAKEVVPYKVEVEVEAEAVVPYEVVVPSREDPGANVVVPYEVEVEAVVPCPCFHARGSTTHLRPDGS